MTKKMISKLKENRGMTIVNVIVAFTLLLLLLAMLSQIIGVAGRMLARSEDIRRQTNNFFRAYYTDTDELVKKQVDLAGNEWNTDNNPFRISITKADGSAAFSMEVPIYEYQFADDESLKFYTFGEHKMAQVETAE